MESGIHRCSRFQNTVQMWPAPAPPQPCDDCSSTVGIASHHHFHTHVARFSACSRKTTTRHISTSSLQNPKTTTRSAAAAFSSAKPPPQHSHKPDMKRIRDCAAQRDESSSELMHT